MSKITVNPPPSKQRMLELTMIAAITITINYSTKKGKHPHYARKELCCRVRHRQKCWTFHASPVFFVSYKQTNNNNKKTFFSLLAFSFTCFVHYLSAITRPPCRWSFFYIIHRRHSETFLLDVLRETPSAKEHTKCFPPLSPQ